MEKESAAWDFMTPGIFCRFHSQENRYILFSPRLLKRLQEENAIEEGQTIPYHALGTAEGKICVYQLEQIQFKRAGEWKILEHPWVGKADEALLQGKSYQVILNAKTVDISKNKRKKAKRMNMFERFIKQIGKLRLLFAEDEILYIGGSDVLPPPLEREQEQRCLIALSGVSGQGESFSREEAKKMLIEHNLRLVVYLAKKV